MAVVVLRSLRFGVLALAGVSLPALAEGIASEADTDSDQPQSTIVVTGARDAPYAIESAVSATKSDAPLLKTPQAIAVVPEQVLLDQQVQTLTDALRNVSGITETNGSFFGDSFTIRGFSSFQSILRDGYGSVQDRAFNAAVQRVEVLKGPASLLYGRFEPGGLINVITKKPQSTFAFDAYAQVSTRGQRRAVADVTGPLGEGLAVRLITDVEHSDYWRSPGRDTERVFLAPSLAFNSGQFSMLLQYEYLDSERPFDRGRLFFNGERLDTPPTLSFAEDFTELVQELHTGNLTIGYAFNPDWRVEGKVAIQRGTGFDLQVRPRRIVLDAQGVPTGEFIRSVDGNRDQSNDRDYYSANLHGKFDTFGVRHNLLIGIDYEQQDQRTGFSVNSPNRGGFDIFNPVFGLLAENVAGLTVNPDSDFLQTFKTIGVYAQDRIEMTDRWTLVLGGRFESFEDFSVFGQALNPPDNDSSADAFLPQVGLVYQPSENTAIYASYSRAFAPNPSTPAIGDQPAFGPFPPEQSRSYEIGFKAQVLSGLTLTAAAYDIKKNNVLVAVDIADGLTETQARDQVTSRGIELDVVGEVTRNFSVIASYAYTDASDPQSTFGDNVQDVAKHTASLSAVYRFTETVPGLSLGGGVFHVGERFGGISNGPTGALNVPFFLDDYTTVDLNAGYSAEIARGSELYGRLTLRNATNENYDQSSGGALRVLPGQSRTLFASVGVRF